MELPINQILQGDALVELKKLPDGCIDCFVTSPPYYALRDYGNPNQIGLEKSMDEYILKLCDIFDEVKRVLKEDGTCWINIGDSYSATRWSGNAKGQPMKRLKDGHRDINPERNSGLPNKNLCLIPFRLALEMQKRGWICRNTIIWHKPACMPSPIKDRFTVDYEFVFFFVKNPKYYFKQQLEKSQYKDANGNISDKARLQRGNGAWHGREIDGMRNQPQAIDKMGERWCPEKRNKRSVWSVNPAHNKENHFATYPEKLIETPIDAGCKEGGIVLDCFFGSGTTGVVALKQKKNFIGIELNPEYIKIANNKLKPFMEQKKL